MPSATIENTLVRYARKRVESARKGFEVAKEEASTGAMPYQDADASCPRTEEAYRTLREAVAELDAAEAALATALDVKTWVCPTPPCGPHHIHGRMGENTF